MYDLRYQRKKREQIVCLRNFFYLLVLQNFYRNVFVNTSVDTKNIKLRDAIYKKITSTTKFFYLLVLQNFYRNVFVNTNVSTKNI